MERAVSLMGIGMITVFLVLLLVVVAGNLLIRLVNTFAPGAEVADSQAKSSASVSSKQVAAITSAVFHATGGKGKVEKIEKI